MSRGIATPEAYYYRRLYVDAVRAVETAASLTGVDPDRIAVAGKSQGGALALAAAALAPEQIRLCQPTSLSATRGGMDVALDPPYTELVGFLSVHPELEGRLTDAQLAT
jgi:cephalosporin-C deacetylase